MPPQLPLRPGKWGDHFFHTLSDISWRLWASILENLLLITLKDTNTLHISWLHYLEHYEILAAKIHLDRARFFIASGQGDYALYDITKGLKFGMHAEDYEQIMYAYDCLMEYHGELCKCDAGVYNAAHKILCASKLLLASADYTYEQKHRARCIYDACQVILGRAKYLRKIYFPT